ncbi:MAG: hypothetical protein B7Y12_10425 [Rhizobiales bacterium 24-66-13]|jgi:flagellar hook-basal body complex protein FliE|uniref:flagellar hook-basal body complex protein FliE n=1 Tax=Roseixanthobacter finlandensis TaxID=3119922 RepID=UPI000BC7CF7D|nr:MAG: hypothetical protein B7Z45_01800 [Azorhizobium sp. 12-66-6]OYY82582.1 MAG: hypothetical protein B7Y61_11485 [Rhizobiales bacterium 35-66-30]OYZ77455.1 MAG: hypothetical protein B7Y12_10425 [Rhizobiales bacterium 24-66-13]OZA95811.1 MAG: hypothetical protein B7X67_25025 [Rhizobiales bacterium 39-66-18]HQS09373.1 flagellar hook-basal body complex protein FliE [Xanthobacteraceae bacterium]
MIDAVNFSALSRTSSTSLGGTRTDTQMTSQLTSKVAPGAAAAPSDFTDMLSQMSSNAVTTLKQGERAAISGISGKASVHHVVEAIMSAEQTLQTAIAVRDKVVAAYQEISRMAI